MGDWKGKGEGNTRSRPSLLSFSLAYDLTPPPSEFRALFSECTEQTNRWEKERSELSRWYVIHPAAQSIAILQGEKESFPLHIAVISYVRWFTSGSFKTMWWIRIYKYQRDSKSWPRLFKGWQERMRLDNAIHRINLDFHLPVNCFIYSFYRCV